MFTLKLTTEMDSFKFWHVWKLKITKNKKYYLTREIELSLLFYLTMLNKEIYRYTDLLHIVTVERNEMRSERKILFLLNWCGDVTISFNRLSHLLKKKTFLRYLGIHITGDLFFPSHLHRIRSAIRAVS